VGASSQARLKAQLNRVVYEVLRRWEGHVRARGRIGKTARESQHAAYHAAPRHPLLSGTPFYFRIILILVLAAATAREDNPPALSYREA